MTQSPSAIWRMLLLGCIVVLIGLGSALLAGCATADDNESDIPWNSPQPWEGSPMIPGINDGR